MEDQIDAILKQLREVTPPDNLEQKILSAVKRVALRRKVIIYLLYSALAPTVLSTIVSIRMLAADISDSSIAELLRLIISDSGDVIELLGTWFLAVMESIPVISLAFTLGSIFILSVIVKRIASALKTNNHHLKGAI